MEINSAEFDKVNKNTKNKFQKSAKVNCIHRIASAKCLNRRTNTRQSCSDNNTNNCCRNNRKVYCKKTTFQGQYLRIQVFQNVPNQLVNFDSMEK